MDEAPSPPPGGSRPARESRRASAIDWYELLEVSPHASQVVIHAAYRALVRDSHPDLNPSAEAASRIRQLNAAYRVLGDSNTRARYDLQCARVRRYERMVRPEQIRLSPTYGEAKAAEALPARTQLPARAVDEVSPKLNGHILLVLLVVAAVATLLFVLIWITLDPSADSGSDSISPVVELYRDGWAAN